jgi:hypothetical protein
MTNYEMLCRDLKFLGFGELLQASLRDAMDGKTDKFGLTFKGKINLDKITARLNFKRLTDSGNIHFTDYDLMVRDRMQQFRIFKGRGVTVKEGYNLLCGRAVFKQLSGREGKKFNVWLQLDLETMEEEGFKTNMFYDNYGFDLETTLSLFPIEPPSSNWNTSMLVKSLQKGNLQPAFLKGSDVLKSVLLEASPKEKTIRIQEYSLNEALSLAADDPKH